MSDERKYLVYKHTAPNNKVYIGITCRTIEARSGHNGIHYKNSPHFYCAIQKYGWDNFTHEVLLDGLTKAEACEKEQYYIRLYQSNNPIFGYNHGTIMKRCVFEEDIFY